MWGIKLLLIASGCGSLRMKMPPGSIVIIDQHINLLPNPLIGPNESTLGPRWPHGENLQLFSVLTSPTGKEPYSQRLIDFGMKIAKEHNMPCTTYVHLEVAA